MSAFIDPTQARKVAAFVEKINQVCQAFGMDFAVRGSAEISVNTDDHEPDTTPFKLVWDPEASQYGLGIWEEEA